MFEVFKSDKNGKTYFRLKAANGETILQSQAYADREGCEKGIASVRKHAADRARFEPVTASDGKHYFRLKAANSQVIGTSQMYAAPAGMEKGIESVMRNAPEAGVVEPPSAD